MKFTELQKFICGVLHASISGILQTRRLGDGGLRLALIILDSKVQQICTPPCQPV